MHVGQRLGDLRAGDRQRGLSSVVVLLSGRRRRNQLLRPVELELGELERRFALFDAGNPGTQQRYLVLDLLHRVLQIPSPASRLRFDAARRRVGGVEIGSRGIDGGLLHGDGVREQLLVQLNEKVTPFHPVVVIHQDAGHLPVDARRDECRVTIHVCIVRRHRAQRETHPGDAEPKRGAHGQNADRPERQVSAA